jgi:molybdenum cofactor cytidylyltransferase
MAGRFFALVPAAGSSSRMGEPKLLLPVAGQPLIARTLAAWERSRVDLIVVVVRPGDHALAAVVRDISKSIVEGRKSKVEVVIPDSQPLDMKTSVQLALAHIERDYSPGEADAFLVAPADIPALSTTIINRLTERHAANPVGAIIVPTIAGQRGHPVLFSWTLAGEVFDLGGNEGLNAIVERHQPALIACEDLVTDGEYPFTDVDTREEYEGLVDRASG